MAVPGGDTVRSTDPPSARRRPWTSPLYLCAAAIASVVAVGCSGKVADECPLDSAARDALCDFDVQREVLLDESFLPSELRAVRAAMEGWSTASGGRIEYRITDGASHEHALSVPVHTGLLAVVRLTSPVDAELMSNIDSAVAARGGSKGSVVGYALPGRLMLLVERIPDTLTLQAVAMHELGHDLGLEHATGTQSVMYAKISGIDDCVLGAPHATTSDIETLGDHYCKKPSLQPPRLQHFFDEF